MIITELIKSPIFFVFWVVAIMVSLTVHEFMHAWTANYLGDDTAKLSGRLTLNPIPHLDPIGSIALLLFGFGWAKPVPINPNRFKNPRMGNALTSIAGPMANLIMAIVFSVIYRFIPGQKEMFTFFVYFMIFLNVRLMIFNLLPFPPLDGSHLLSLVIRDPKKMMIFESAGVFLLIPVILFAGPFIITPLSDFFMKLLIG